MAKIKTIILKYLFTFSAILTGWQIKMVNAQMVYMPGPGFSPTPSSGGIVAKWWVIFVTICIFALIGLIVAIKYLADLVVRLLSKKRK